MLSGEAADQTNRVVTVRVKSARQAALVGVFMEKEVRLIEARVGQREVPVGEGPWSVFWVAPPQDGFTLMFKLPVGQPLKYRVMDGTPGLPPGTAPRPDNLIPWFGRDYLVPTDATLVTKSFNL